MKHYPNRTDAERRRFARWGAETTGLENWMREVEQRKALEAPRKRAEGREATAKAKARRAAAKAAAAAAKVTTTTTKE